MSEFIPINTQEEFDSAIKSRLARERDTISKQYADYDSLKDSIKTLTDQNNALTQAATEHTEKVKSLQDQLKEAEDKITGYQMDIMKTSIAVEKGLPLELRDRLTGSTEEELKSDADKLVKLFAIKNQSGLPMANLHQELDGDSSTVAQKKFEEWFKKINE